MDFKERSKELFEVFSLNLMLKFNSRQKENRYRSAQDLFSPSASYLTYVFLVFHLMSFYNSPYSCFSLLSLTFMMLLFAFQNISYYMLYLSYFISPQNLSEHQTGLLLLEFLFHYKLSKSFLFYILSLFLRTLIYKKLLNHGPEVLFCIAMQILLTKDLKYLWGKNIIYEEITNELKESFQSESTGYFITDPFGKILFKSKEAQALENNLKINSAGDLTKFFSDDFSGQSSDLTLRKIIKNECEFLYLYKPFNGQSKFSSVNIKIIPLLIKNQSNFLITVTDINAQISERELILELFKEAQNFLDFLLKKLLSLYNLKAVPDSYDLSSIKTLILKQIETKVFLSLIIGSCDLNIYNVDIKTEVLNTIQVVWDSWSIQDSKFNLLIDKDLPIVRTDPHKHNLILKLMLEFIMNYYEKTSNLLLTVTRSSLLKFQYKFKFYSNQLTQAKISSIFNRNWIKSKKLERSKAKSQKNICIILSLLKILNGSIEETKVSEELRKISITYSFSFSAGNDQRCPKVCLVNQPEDTFIFSWPFCVLPKRTKISVTRLRRMIHSHSHVLTSVSALSNTLSLETLSQGP